MPKKKTGTAKKTKTNHLSRSVSFLSPTFLVFLVAFVAIGGYTLWRLFAAAPPVTIYLVPASQTLPANTTFNVQVRESSSTTPINAVQANFSYNPALVDFVSIDTTGTAFGTTAQTTGGSGSVAIALGTCGGCAQLTGDQLVATVTFKTKTTSGTTNMAFTTGSTLVRGSDNTDILGSLANTVGGTYIVDVAPPVVTLTSPTNGATVSSLGTTSIQTTATDNISVSSVDVYIDGTKKTTLTVSPYNYNWNPSGLALGAHTIQAKATDQSGNVGSSALITVNVTDQTAPTVSITAPSSGSFVKGSAVNVAVNASDTGGSGISKVEFYVDGALKTTDLTAPYSAIWDTTTATNATHTLTVKAYDGATPANVATSSALSVTVDNSAPSAPGNFNTSSNTTTSISLSWTAASDNQGVVNYSLSRNGNVIATLGSSTLSYTDSGLAPATIYSYTLVALDAAGNSSPVASFSATTQSGKTGDLNNDNKVDVTDLSILLSNWATPNPVADINKDGIVNVIDLSILLTNFGK